MANVTSHRVNELNPGNSDGEFDENPGQQSAFIPFIQPFMCQLICIEIKIYSSYTSNRGVYIVNVF